MPPSLSVRDVGIRASRIRLLTGCMFGRHLWEKQRGTFGTKQVAPNGEFYEAFYCAWCGSGYPRPSLARMIWDEVSGR